MSASPVRSVLLLLALIFGLGCDGGPRSGDSTNTGAQAGPPPGLPEVELTIGIHRVTAEVANTLARRRQGLSGRRVLEPGRGMIFPYDPPEQPAFWMPDMHFDIDILWIQDRTIIDVHHDVPHEVERPLPTYAPSRPVDWVLEVPAGTAAARGWKVGDRVQAEPEPVFLD